MVRLSELKLSEGEISQVKSQFQVSLYCTREISSLASPVELEYTQAIKIHGIALAFVPMSQCQRIHGKQDAFVYN